MNNRIVSIVLNKCSQRKTRIEEEVEMEVIRRDNHHKNKCKAVIIIKEKIVSQEEMDKAQ